MFLQPGDLITLKLCVRKPLKLCVRKKLSQYKIKKHFCVVLYYKTPETLFTFRKTKERYFIFCTEYKRKYCDTRGKHLDKFQVISTSEDNSRE